MPMRESSTRVISASPNLLSPVKSPSRNGAQGSKSRGPSAKSPSQGSPQENNHTHLVSLENFEQVTRIKGVFNSPRSLQACEMEEVKPDELLYRDRSDFAGPGVPENLARMRYIFYENRRKEKLERVRKTWEKLMMETKEIMEESKKNTDMKDNQETKDPWKHVNLSDSFHSPGPRLPTQNSHTHRSSSSPPYRVSGSKSCISSNGKTSRNRPNSRSPSVAAMRIYSRAFTENRSPSEAERILLKRIEERESRAAERKERAASSEKNHEKSLIQVILGKELQTLDHMIKKEAKRLTVLNRNLHQWGKKLGKVRERQRSESEARSARVHMRRSSTYNHQENSTFRFSSSRESYSVR